MRSHRKLMALLGAALVCAGCSIAPQGRTLELKRPQTAEATAAPMGQLSFDIDKIYLPQLSKLDPEGYTANPRDVTLGWADNDRLLGIMVQERQPGDSPRGETTQSTAQSAADRRKGAMQPDETDGYRFTVASLDYRYSFLEGLLTLPDDSIENILLSSTGAKLACLTRNPDDGQRQLHVYNTATGEQLYAQVLDIADPNSLIWSNNDRFLCYRGDGSDTLICLLEVDTGQVDAVFRQDEWDELVGDATLEQVEFVDDVKQQVVLRGTAGKKSQLLIRIYFWSDGSTGPQVMEDYYATLGDAQWQYVDGETALVLVNNQLLQVEFGDKIRETVVAEDVAAFGLSHDGKYVSYSRLTNYASMDLYVARYLNGQLLNAKSVYKGFWSDGRTMLFSPDSHRLLVSGQRREGSLKQVIMVLEFG
ncbi:MAG: hypothetical protein PHO66_01210 [Eubacteriales bacterium]|nr:hypothetical protein [Eubacteriales bacterium]